MPITPTPWENGQQTPVTCFKVGRLEEGECPCWTASTEARGAFPRAPLCRHHSAQSQLAKTCVLAFVAGFNVGTPLVHGERAVGPKDGRLGEVDFPTPDIPHGGTRRPLWMHSSCPHSAESQLARACAVG